MCFSKLDICLFKYAAGQENLLLLLNYPDVLSMFLQFVMHFLITRIFRVGQEQKA